MSVISLQVVKQVSKYFFNKCAEHLKKKGK